MTGPWPTGKLASSCVQPNDRPSSARLQPTNARGAPPSAEALPDAPDATAPGPAGREPSPAWQGSDLAEGPDKRAAAKLGPLTQPGSRPVQ